MSPRREPPYLWAALAGCCTTCLQSPGVGGTEHPLSGAGTTPLAIRPLSEVAGALAIALASVSGWSDRVGGAWHVEQVVEPMGGVFE